MDNVSVHENDHIYRVSSQQSYAEGNEQLQTCVGEGIVEEEELFPKGKL